MNECVALSGGNFETEVIASTVPVLIDFWAPWCGPCRMLAPTIEAIAADYAGRLKVAKVNVDEEGALAERHNVVSIPTLVVYQGGKLVNRQVGALPREGIECLFKDLLPPAA